MSDRTQTLSVDEVKALTGKYCASYIGGLLDNEGGFVDSREPIRMEGGEYRWLETGSDGDAVFEWQETVSVELEREEAEMLWALADEAEGLFGGVPSEGPGRRAIDKLRAALSQSTRGTR